MLTEAVAVMRARMRTSKEARNSANQPFQFGKTVPEGFRKPTFFPSPLELKSHVRDRKKIIPIPKTSYLFFVLMRYNRPSRTPRLVYSTVGRVSSIVRGKSGYNLLCSRFVDLWRASHSLLLLLLFFSGFFLVFVLYLYPETFSESHFLTISSQLKCPPRNFIHA